MLPWLVIIDWFYDLEYQGRIMDEEAVALWREGRKGLQKSDRN